MLSSDGRIVGWTLCLAVVFSVVVAGPATADHGTSDDWEGGFDPAQHSTVVDYQYSRLLTHTFSCDTPSGCVWPGDNSFHSPDDTVEQVCEFLFTEVLWGDCSDSAPGGWTLVSSVEQIHDPPTWSLRFCTVSGWGQSPLEDDWGTTDGPIDAEGHRSNVDEIGESMWFDPVPVATSIHEPPFCGVWARTTPPEPGIDPVVVEPQTCSREGFVWFSEYGGCRPEDCSAIGGGYVRNPDDGWCEPAPPPGGILNSCIANFEILFPDLARRSSYDEPHERRAHCSGRRLNYVPVWVTDHDGDAQRAETSQTVTHRVLHITGATPVLNPPSTGFDWNPDNRCDGADELNVHAAVDYDCLQVSVTAQAGFAGVNYSGSHFRASGCANPVGWAQTAERVCDSAAGVWYGTAQEHDPGAWTVTVGDLARAGTSDHLVSVPFVVDVADWGDADWLQITAVASDYWDSATHSTSRDTVTFRVARREGPPPSSDIIEVNVHEVADLPYSEGSRWVWWPRPGRWVPHIDDRRFVKIARSELLANDACPADLDCTDPAQWPVSVPALEAQRCTSWAFKARPTSRMLSTGQGLVGCDDLNDATDAGVQYWPRHWAAGTDTFTYETPGGVATVAVRFTDAPPVSRDVLANVAGTTYHTAGFDAPAESSVRYCYVWNSRYNTCQRYKYRYYVGHVRSDNLSFAAELFTAGLRIDEIMDTDPEGDAAHLDLIAGHNPELSGGVGVHAASGGPSLWDLDETSASTYSNNPLCGYHGTCLSDAQLLTSFLRRPLDDPVNPDTGTALTGVSGCVQAGTASITTDLTIYRNPNNGKAAYPGELRHWTGDDPGAGCAPALAASCDAGAGAIPAWTLCLTLWPDSPGPQQLDLAYRACDERLDAFNADRAAAEAAGRTEADYCSEGTITVLLGDCIWDPTDAERAALAALVGWHSFLEALPEGPPGERWPPHPEVPGGDRHIVVANSPVWPRVATADALDVDKGAGCVWSAQWLRATVTQMLPWVPAHRTAVETHGGLAQWLGMWDRLSAGQRAEAQRLHDGGDLTSVACPITAAADGTQPAEQNLSYRQCRWELARPGVWHWTLDAGFTDGTRTVTETLAEDITWFRSFNAYTNQRTWWRDGRAQPVAG
ncbi:MAG: hypothetical protein OXG66_20430 [Acidimicrobiaceae bacterium]|nr:hypothetical protein [Acidimicrobiaceae bacterium]